MEERTPPTPQSGENLDNSALHADSANHSLVLIGEKFATCLMLIEDEAVIVKMEDYRIPERQNVRVYREYLAFRLASRVGLEMPLTSLRRIPPYGRLSVQLYVHRATKPLPQSLDNVMLGPLGMRIVLFDILCGNHDRKPDNLLQQGTRIIAIDFNTAFQPPPTVDTFEEEVDALFARWFRIRHMLSLTSAHRSVLLEEAQQMVSSLDDSFLRACLAEIPRSFCEPTELEQVRLFLTVRRDALYTAVSNWWSENVAPLHVLDPTVLALIAREHAG